MIAERKGHAEVAHLLKSRGAESILPARAAASRDRGGESINDLPEFPDHIED
jgi:hypothetical protein